VKLVHKLGKGVEVKIITDQAQFRNPSCVRQPQRLLELLEAGAKIRYYRPPGGDGWPIMHIKGMVIDGRVCTSGSANLTNAGFQNNKEHLLVIRHAGTVADMERDFARLWDKSTEATKEELEGVNEKVNGRNRNRSVSKTRSSENLTGDNT